MEVLKRRDVDEAVAIAGTLVLRAVTEEQVECFTVRIPGWPRKLLQYVETVQRQRLPLHNGIKLSAETMTVGQAGQPPALATQFFEVNVPGRPEPLRFNANSAELPHPSLLPVLQYAHANFSIIHQDQQDRTG